jgi:hypothetical protein
MAAVEVASEHSQSFAVSGRDVTSRDRNPLSQPQMAQPNLTERNKAMEQYGRSQIEAEAIA